MYALNNVTTTPEYTEPNTLQCPGTTEICFIISTAGIYVQYAFRGTGYSGLALQWSDDVFFPPGYFTRPRNVDGIRVRSAVPAKPANVTIEAVS